MENSSIKLRPATWADYDFLYALKRAALRPYVEQTWGKWDEAQQEDWFRRHFTPEENQIITYHNQDIGVLSVDRRESDIFIGNIELLPEFQGKGIGTTIINIILTEARRKQLPVTLQVLKVNPARRLYERLGFTITAETPTHYLMQAKLQKME